MAFPCRAAHLRPGDRINLSSAKRFLEEQNFAEPSAEVLGTRLSDKPGKIRIGLRAKVAGKPNPVDYFADVYRDEYFQTTRPQ